MVTNYERLWSMVSYTRVTAGLQGPRIRYMYMYTINRGNSEKEGSWIREVCVGETEWSEKAETYQRERTEHEEWSS